MFKIEITDTKVETRTITGKDGKQYTIHTQGAYFHGSDRYPKPFKLNLENDAPHPPGLYSLANDSVWIDRYGNLVFARFLRLARIDQSK